MANYLPVLLVSVNTNTIPDDNVLTTMPRGQVDYLSHDWQEEDVWRSWRNMTRQKNEITNGIRLENASWRTWWKQRNKLKTVSPETLNWLKDSDVTWLYGPLHTAVEWTPPPKPRAVPDSVDSGNPASTHDRLDLHSGPPSTSRRPQPPRTKPILKHRSISELLTSELPVSPVFSSPESEDESNHTHSHSASGEDALNATKVPKRPALVHTKSDSHITRWGPSRVFRKASPPRVPPPTPSDKSPLRHSTSTVRASGIVRNSLSQDSASSASGSSERTSKKKHISFNTFVEQYIAIDKHPQSGKKGKLGLSSYPGQYELGDEEDEDDDESHNDKWDDDDGYEEDREDNLFDEDDPLWLAAHGGVHPRRRHLDGSAIHSDSDSDDDAIEIRPSSHRHASLVTPSSKKRTPIRSKSVSSSSSATTTTSTSASSSGGISRQRRKSATYPTSDRPLPHLLSPPPSSAYRPRIPSLQSDPSYRDRVTIAPIAPTLLKTTGAWEEGFGDEGGASDDGLWDYGVPGHGVNGTSNDSRKQKDVGGREEEEHSSEGTPVELVYVPPFGSIYGHGAGTYWHSRGAPDGEDEEEDEGEGTKEAEEVKIQLEESQMQKESPSVNSELGGESATSPISTPAEPVQSISRSPIPVVVIDSNDSIAQPASISSDKTDKNGSTSSSSSSTLTGPMLILRGGRHQHEEEQDQGRGRNTSVSPVGVAHSSRPASEGNGGLLASRSRSQSCQDLQSFYNTPVTTTSSQGSERRGRSHLRGPSDTGNGSTSGSRRGSHSSQSVQSLNGRHQGGSGSVSPSNNISSASSPMGGSISPDSSDSRLGGIGGAYVGGRRGGRERERVERVGSGSSLSSKATTLGGGSDERRGRDRGRRIIGSGSGSSTSPIPNSAQEEARERGRKGTSARGGASPSPQEIFDMEPTSSSPRTAVITEVKGKGKESISLADESVSFISDTAQSVEMDASIYSVSSEGSTATIVPTSPTIMPRTPTLAADVPLVSDKEQWSGNDAMEAENRRKTAPTPSNSPIIFMTLPQARQNKDGTATSTPSLPPSPPVPPLAFVITPLPTPSLMRTPEHVRTASASSTRSRNAKPKTSSSAPIVPSPPHPVLPSTSASHAPGEVGSPTAFTGFGANGRSASRSLERASSESRERHSPSSSSPSTTHIGSGLRRNITEDEGNEREVAEAKRGRNHIAGVSSVSVDLHANTSTGFKEPTSPVTNGHKERETIVDKAVGMMSSAGAYLKLWPNYNDA